MVAYRIELRRSPLRWWIPLLAAVTFAVMFTARGGSWVGVWPQASSAAELSAMYLAPLLAAVAAWAAVRSSQRGVTEILTAAARPRWRVEASQLAATLSYGLGIYVLAAAVAAAVSARLAGPGFLWPAYIALGAAVLAICAGVGHVVGRLSRSRFAVPAICGLALFVFLNYLSAPAESGPAGQEYSSQVLQNLQFAGAGAPWQVFRTPALVVRLALGAAAVVIAVAALNPWRRPAWSRRSWRPVVVVGVIVCLAAGLAALISAGPLLTERAVTIRPVCTAAAPRMCLWPEDRKYLPQLAAISRRLATLPPGLVAVPRQFHEQSLLLDKGTPVVVPGSFADIMGGGDLPFAIADMAAGIVSTTFPHACAAQPGTPPYNAWLNLTNWLTLRAAGNLAVAPPPAPGGDPAAAARIVRQPEASQVAWVQQQEKDIRNARCPA